ncbi:MAG: hypothetical protein ABSA76_12540 [Bacteroidales bacterium]
MKKTDQKKFNERMTAGLKKNNCNTLSYSEISCTKNKSKKMTVDKMLFVLIFLILK